MEGKENTKRGFEFILKDELPALLAHNFIKSKQCQHFEAEKTEKQMITMQLCKLILQKTSQSSIKMKFNHLTVHMTRVLYPLQRVVPEGEIDMYQVCFFWKDDTLPRKWESKAPQYEKTYVQVVVPQKHRT